MNVVYEEIEEKARKLPFRQKADLARILIEDLDTEKDPDVEKLWIEEAERRYKAFQRGEIEAIPGDEVMARLRDRLR